ncbi:MAG: hypothetical protein HQ559_01750 [Lentisphaerae bacterium]|nr:hypothetical protein [Lentisphaerota bacterium]
MDKIERLKAKARENKLTAVMYEDALREMVTAEDYEQVTGIIGRVREATDKARTLLAQG